MKAMIVIQTRNGYAALPFDGTLPADSVQDIQIATCIEETPYSFGKRGPAVCKILEEFFEPEPVPEEVPTPLKVA